MTLNAAISINKGTDFILQLIESECTKATEGWRREFEAQQQYVKTLHAQLLRVQTERDVALADFGKAREEAAWHKERYAAAAQEQTERSDVYWEAEAHRLTAEVQSWKDKHEVALRLRDDAERQLERTRTRFSLTVVPLGPLDLPSANSPASALNSSTSRCTEIAETYSPNVSPTSNAKCRKFSNTTYPTHAAAGDPLSNETPPQSTNTVYLTSGPAYQSDFSQATSSVAQYQLPCVAPGSLVNRHNPPGINTIHHTSASGVPSTSNDPPPTAERQEKWCYCGHYEYGKMVMCSGPNCAKQWFHMPCTGLKQVPTGDWLCNNCTPPQPAARTYKIASSP